MVFDDNRDSLRVDVTLVDVGLKKGVAVIIGMDLPETVLQC